MKNNINMNRILQSPPSKEEINASRQRVWMKVTMERENMQSVADNKYSWLKYASPVLASVLVLALLASNYYWYLDRKELAKLSADKADIAYLPYYVYQNGSADDYLNISSKELSEAAPAEATPTPDSSDNGQSILADVNLIQNNPFLPKDVAIGVRTGETKGVSSAKKNFSLFTKAHAGGAYPVVYYITRPGTVTSKQTTVERLMEFNTLTKERIVLREYENAINWGAKEPDPDYKTMHSVRYNQQKQLLIASVTSKTPLAQTYGVDDLVLIDPSGAKEDKVIAQGVNNVTTMQWSTSGEDLIYLSQLSDHSMELNKYNLAENTISKTSLKGDLKIEGQLKDGFSVNYSTNDFRWSPNSKRILFDVMYELASDQHNASLKKYSYCSVTLSDGNTTCTDPDLVPNKKFEFGTDVGEGSIIGLTTTPAYTDFEHNISGPKWVAEIGMNGAVEYKDKLFKATDFLVLGDGSKVIVHARRESNTGPQDYIEYKVWNRVTGEITSLPAVPGVGVGNTRMIGFNGNDRSLLVNDYDNGFYVYDFRFGIWSKL